MVDQAEIHRKVVGGNIYERRGAAYQLHINFAILPDKEQAWKDLHQLAQDEDSHVLRVIVGTVATAFSYIPDKEQAWKDLMRLTQDKNSYVRWTAADALGHAFHHILDKEPAWKDPMQLTQDKDRIMPKIIILPIGSCGSRFIQDEFSIGHIARRNTVDAFGHAVQHIPDKEQALRDMHRLTQDGDKHVRASANHFLGRASIVKAAKAEKEEDFKKELKNALEFFEKSLEENAYFNPSSFCLPFYRSFYIITFEKQKAEAEVQKYLAEAKKASKRSGNKKILLKAVENLANALKEVHKARESNLDAIKRNLNTCRQYCDRAAYLIGAAEEKTPGAAQVLQRGLPIIDERIKEIIREIQEKSRAVCKLTQGTPLEELGLETTRYAQELPIQDPLALAMALCNLSSIARDWCEYIPADKKIHACEQLDNLANMEISEQGTALAGVFEFINTNIHIPRIQTVHISAIQQEIVRIAVVQFCFELTESFPFAIKNEDEVKAKFFSALDITKEDSANIVCLPELCLCEEWISEIKEKYPDMIVIGGSFYKDDKNISPVIMESDVDIPCQPKITPSASEDSGIMESRMVPGDRVNRYETQFGKFVILMCRDFDNLAHYFRNMTDTDMIFCPCLNSVNERFHKEADVHVEKIPSYVLIANAGLYGGTSIFGRLNRNYFSALVDGGCKDAGDLSYKLCEVKKGREEVIIADFNLIHKSVQVPTPSNPNEEIRSVENIQKIPIQLKQRTKK